MEKLCKGMRFQSGKTYVADNGVIDVYMQDTFYCDNKEALSSTRLMKDSCQVGFLLENLHDVTLDFGGAKVVFHGRIVPFVLLNCQNVVIKNLKIDYDRPFFTQADVLSVKDGEIEMRICDGFDYTIKDGYLYAKAESWEKNLNANDCLLWLYDKSGKKNYDEIILGLFGDEIFPNENPPIPIRHLHIREKGDRQIVYGEFPKQWDTNDGNNCLLITHEIRDKNTFTLVGGSDIVIENCILIHGAAFGIMGMYVHNVRIDNFSMYNNYDGNGRLVTNNADAIHMFHCTGLIEVKNCQMEGLLDDTINIHNNYFSVKKAENNCLALYTQAAGVSDKYKVYCKLFNVGDKIAVYRGKTVEKVADLTITAMWVDEKEMVRYVAVDGDVSAVSENDTVENMSAQPEIHVHDCTFGSFRGTMRLQSRNKTVLENCVFGNKEVSLFFTGDTRYWFESGPVNDMIIRNCVFDGVQYGARLLFLSEMEFTEKDKYYHKNLLVENCTFKGKGMLADLRHVDNYVARNNVFEQGSYIKATDCGKIDSDAPIRE